MPTLRVRPPTPPARAVRAALTLACVAWLAACGPTITTDPPLEDGQPLDPGGYVEAADGTRVGASLGAFDGDLSVAIRPVADPFADVPLPDDVTPVGDAVEVVASADAYVPSFAVGFVAVPVPPGSDPVGLALAVLEPADPIDDGEDAPDAWSILPATLDPDTGLLTAMLGGFTEAGRIVVPVRVEGFDATPSSAAARAAVSARAADVADTVGAAQWVPVPGIEWRDGFIVRCIGFAAGACTQSDRDTTEATLDGVYAAWVDGLGFAEPRLVRRVEIVRYFPLEIIVHEKEFQLRHFGRTECNNTNGRGRYLRATSEAYTCFDPAQAQPAHRTTRHEFFHALQYGFPSYLANRSTVPEGVAEGMARTAEMSQGGLQRSFDRVLRAVDRPILVVGDSGDPRYQEQDFWVYLGLRFGADLEYLIPMLEAGGRLADVAATLANHAGYPENLTLSDAYWAWVVNQTFEKTIDLGGGVLGAPCTLNDGVRGPTSTTSSPVATPVVLQHALNVPASTTFSLQPLESRVVQVNFPSYAAGAYDALVDVAAGGPEVRVRFFDAADAGTTDCVGDAERTELAVVRDAGAGTVTHYALIANTSTSTARTATVTSTPQPRLEIVAPAEGDRTFADGELVAFEVSATGFGVAAGDVDVVWTYRVGAAGTPVPFATATADQVVQVDTLPCADLLVTAAATGPGGATAPSDDDTIAVSCAGPGTLFVNADPSRSGTVAQDGFVYLAQTDQRLTVGDNSKAVGERAMLHFPLNVPDGRTIEQATLSFTIRSVDGLPYTVLTELRGYRADLGADLDAGDYTATPLLGGLFYPPFDGTTGPGRLDVDVTSLVQAAYDERATYGDVVQLILYFPVATNGDNVNDRIVIEATGPAGTYLLPALEVVYSAP